MRGLLIGSCGLLVFEILLGIVPRLKQLQQIALPAEAAQLPQARFVIAVSDFAVQHRELFLASGFFLYGCFLLGIFRFSHRWWAIALCLLYEVLLITSAIVLLRMWGESLENLLQTCVAPR
ncbi:hypothetical protein [Planctomicrobium sp. SH664]|uniref:hypothetical protein n=1 Tax=Planctomicrobium sp. SH664 TaxID=3448125 RepID=UPI003F5BE962